MTLASNHQNQHNQSNSPKVGFVSLGCPKAQVDSEHIITQLKTEGYEIAADYQSADVVIVNTCGFIEDAVNESLDAIGEALQENGKVIVTGCLGAKKEQDGSNIIQQKHPNVLGITGPHATHEVMHLVHQHLPRPHEAFHDLVPKQGVRLTPRHYAYLKISEGCNHRCSFCIIPSMRGDLVSRSVSSILDEAQALLKAGVKELLVISQDTSAYGVDVKFKLDFWQGKPIRTHLTDLAKALGELAKNYGAWVRLHYVYPYPHVDEVIPLMQQGLILPYLDIPMQHASPSVLKRMKRPANGEKNLERIQKWREICPEIVIRSTFIVGFPGETDEEFEELIDFLQEAKLDRVGCFQYSDVEGATANDLPNHVAPEIKQARYDRFMEVSSAISAEKLAQKVNQTIQVMIDDIDEDSIYARSVADAPEIDGLVYLDPSLAKTKNYKTGQMIQVIVEEADEYDLWAKPAED
jgi:ribosomal protein S12 methylthiotransferase